MAKVSQQSRVLVRLKTMGSITRAEALLDLGIANLPDAIHKLREKGYLIESLMIPTTNQFGEDVEYCRYVYHGRMPDEDEADK